MPCTKCTPRAPEHLCPEANAPGSTSLRVNPSLGASTRKRQRVSERYRVNQMRRVPKTVIENREPGNAADIPPGPVMELAVHSRYSVELC